MFRATKFRVQNYRNINDSGWIPVERVTAFVGRNESGKTALLKALHKFNPAIPEPYDPQREFPRDRYTREFKHGKDWPVCSIVFTIDETLQKEIEQILGEGCRIKEVVFTRFYDGSVKMECEPQVISPKVDPAQLIEALTTFANEARRLPAPVPEQEEQTQKLRTDLANWATLSQEKLKGYTDLRGEAGISLLSNIRAESNSHANPQTADIIEALQSNFDKALEEARKPPVDKQLGEILEKQLPIFIYFEEYGVLDSAIHFPSFLEQLQSRPTEPRVRTVNAVFKHVGLSAQDIKDLGTGQAELALIKNQPVTDQMISEDQQKKDARAIKLNSASLDITDRFTAWYGQRRHTIEYQADGDYFRIWIADDRRPGVKIELEARSKGFQWFFSFYLIFLVESDEGHKDAILLLDEPGLHLHPTAQQELIAFFEKLSEKNQLLYTTHSPFLVDGDNIHRVRPVTEDESGHSHVSTEGWPKDRETIFPLQAAAGYAMVRGLFQHKQNILVEGMSDYYYLHALSQQCRANKRECLSDAFYITPCGGTKMVGQIAALFLGQEVRPLVLLDGDEAGRVRRDALLKELYSAHGSAILMLDEALGQNGQEVEIEDIIGEQIILEAACAVLEKGLELNEADREKGSLPSQIKSAADRLGIELPEGWKPTLAIKIVSEVAEGRTVLPLSVLDKAAMLFHAIGERFDANS